MLDDARKIAIGKMLYFGGRCNVRRVLAASPVRSVTTSTIGRKNSCPRGLRSQSSRREQPQNGSSDR